MAAPGGIEFSKKTALKSIRKAAPGDVNKLKSVLQEDLYNNRRAIKAANRGRNCPAAFYC